MGREVISEAEVQIGLNDSGLLAGLKRAEAAVDATYKSIDSKDAKPEVHLDKKSFDLAIKEVQTQLAKLERERTRAVINVDVDGAVKAQLAIDKLKAKAELLGATRSDIKVGVDKKALTWVQQLDHGMTGLNERFKQMRILNVPVHFFNLTLRLKQLIAVFVATLPMVTSLLGSFTSLVSMLGMGLGGALAGAAAGFGILMTGMAGVGAVLVPIVRDFKAASQASKEYHTAVAKFGKDSVQAENRLKQLKNTMGHISPETAKAVASIGKLGKEWNKIAAGGRGAFYTTMAEGIRTIRANMQLFGREGKQSLSILGRETRIWFREMRSHGGRGVFKALSDEFQANTPGIMRSLSNIVSGFAHLAVAAAPIFSRFVGWLERWSSGWRRATGDAGRMKPLMDQLSDSAASLGKFFGSAGRLIAAVFRSGADSGMGLLDSMTGIMDRWTEWINSNPEKVSKFFNDAADMTRNIFKFLGQVVALFADFAAAARPAAAAVLSVLNNIIRLRAIAIPLAGALAGIWAINRVITFVNWVQRAVVALKTLAAAQAISTFAGAVIPGRGSKAAPKYPIGTATRFGAQTAAAGATGAAASKAMAGVTAGAIGATAGVVALAASVALVGHEFAKWQEGKRWDKLRGYIDDYNQHVSENLRLQQQLPGSIQAEKQSLQQLRQARVDYNRDRNPASLRALDQAEAAYHGAQQQRISEERQLQQRASQAVIAARRRQVQASLSAMMDGKAGQNALREATEEVEHALTRSERSSINFARAQRGLQPILGDVGMKAGLVAKGLHGISKTTFKNFVAKVDYSSAVKATNAMAKLRTLGASSAGIKILADTRNPETALRRLQLLTSKLTKARHLVAIGAQDKASKILSDVQLKALGLTRKEWKAMIGAKTNTKDLDAFIRKVYGIPKARSTRISAPGARQATSDVQGFLAQVLSIPSVKRVTVAVTETLKRNRQAGGMMNAFASGGVHMTGAAMAGGARRTTGERVTRPQFLTGEDSPSYPEFVLATNPAYRRRNLRLWVAAGTQLGVSGAAAMSSAMGARAFKKGGSTARQKKALKKTKSHIKYVDHVNDAELKKYGPYKSYRTREAELKRASEKFDQDARDYDIQARGRPIVDKDGNLNQGNLDFQKNNLQNLIDSKTGILGLQKVIADLARQIVGYINKSLMGRWESEEKKVKRSTTLSASGKRAALSLISKHKSDLRGDRGKFQERLEELGDESRGQIRDSLLDVASLKADKADLDTEAAGASSAGGSAGSSDVATQALQRASAAERALAISEAAFRVFRGPGDIGSGGRSAIAAAAGPAGGTGALGLGVRSDGGAGPEPRTAQVIHINTLHPGDPRTLAAIGNAAAAGMGHQGYRGAPRERLAI